MRLGLSHRPGNLSPMAGHVPKGAGQFRQRLLAYALGERGAPARPRTPARHANRWTRQQTSFFCLKCPNTSLLSRNPILHTSICADARRASLSTPCCRRSALQSRHAANHGHPDVYTTRPSYHPAYKLLCAHFCRTARRKWARTDARSLQRRAWFPPRAHALHRRCRCFSQGDHQALLHVQGSRGKAP